ncbi:VOC family protein [Actinokineospora fastidiosa]|uniref:VOC domain-containing protein n=1 Tax=Actinokineospora fastidiosa TaxID=1816 RepID=A0A918GCS0_9PSEU|nr:VOC family protein [Actinokineospora fastidiosa]GGS28683.1 hypothetical protein GCM10010171_22250 [Actinokineospora fastidiosa]
MTHPVVHFEIGTKDGERAGAFYRDLFGWQLEPAGPGYSLISPQDGGIGGGLMEATEDIPTYVTVYVQVEDLRASLDRAVALGGAVAVEPMPIEGVGSFALFQDPDGNTIGLMQTAGASS